MPTSADRPTTKQASKESGGLQDAVERYEYRNKNIRRTIRRAMRYRKWSNNELSRRSGVGEGPVGLFMNGALNARMLSTVEPMMRALRVKYFFRGKVSSTFMPMLSYAAEHQGLTWGKAFLKAGLTEQLGGQYKNEDNPNPHLYTVQSLINILKINMVYE